MKLTATTTTITATLAFALLSLSNATPAAKRATRRLCGTGNADDELELLHRRDRTSWQQSSPTAALAARQQNSDVIDIETHVHVVLSEAKKESVSNATLAEQFALLASAYEPHNITFTLASTTRYINDTLSLGPIFDTPENSALWTEFKDRARKGDFAVLNLFYYSDFQQDLYGYCNRPYPEYKNDSHAINIDGCNMKTGTLPGGDIEGFNQGGTTIHEVGHWLGLFHTFQGFRCEGDGDYVDDTPMQSIATEGCPESQDSCPDQPGLDPIHNFMDYGTDECVNEFTPGQVARMRNTWYTVRN